MWIIFQFMQPPRQRTLTTIVLELSNKSLSLAHTDTELFIMVPVFSVLLSPFSPLQQPHPPSLTPNWLCSFAPVCLVCRWQVPRSLHNWFLLKEKSKMAVESTLHLRQKNVKSRTHILEMLHFVHFLRLERRWYWLTLWYVQVLFSKSEYLSKVTSLWLVQCIRV